LKDAIDSQLLEKVARLPENPGVYIMRDYDGTIIYVGKAVNLKNRIRSYFKFAGTGFEDYSHVPRINDIDIL
jgi:excinuclease ABC subunit C